MVFATVPFAITGVHSFTLQQRVILSNVPCSCSPAYPDMGSSSHTSNYYRTITSVFISSSDSVTMFLDRERRYRMLEKKASLLDSDCGRQRLSDVTVCQHTVSCLFRRLLWRSPVSQHTSLLVVSVKALLVIDEGVFGPFWIWFSHQEIVFLL